MSTAREEVLQRIRTAVGDAPRKGSVPRGYRQADGGAGDVELLVERLLDYKAQVTRTDTAGLADSVAAQLAAAVSVVVPEGVPAAWTSRLSGVPVLRDEPALTARQLDGTGAVLTGCALAVAETGTIVLDHGPGQGRGALTLVPDHHVVVVHVDQVVRGVVEAVATLTPQRPMTWISGPSATSDIELHRVEGVHGPRTLDVILIEP